jgi:hypothetical protein
MRSGEVEIHTTLSVKTPPRSGPATEAIPYMPPTRPEYMGLLESGTECARISKAPENKPAAPIPATALPIIKVMEFWATPQIRLPSSKIPMALRKTHLMLRKVYSFPKRSWRQAVVRR